jgi:hypothetical protein
LIRLQAVCAVVGRMHPADASRPIASAARNRLRADWHALTLVGCGAEMSPDVRTTGVNETSSLNIGSSSARLYAAGCELVHYQGPNGSL